MSGNNVSHANNKTRRRFLPNLHTQRFWLEGEKVRIADIDTPEISEPQCASEYERGIEARDRLVVLLNEGPFELEPVGNRDEDQYARKLRVAVRGGQSIGDRLVSEGLARTWTGRREPWC